MPLLIDSPNRLIKVTSPTTDVDAQTLADFIEDYMATPEGLLTDGVWPGFAGQGDIQDPQGKIEDPAQPGVFSQIIIQIHPQWQIQFWGGSGYTRIFGAKIVGGVADEPMKATGTAGDITVLESPVDGLVVATGSGLSVGQSTQLEEAHGQIERSIYIDTSALTNGNGYQQTPYDNFTDAVDDAEANGIRSLVILADATVDRQLKNFIFRGVGNPSLDGNGQDLDKSEFHDLKLTGTIDPASVLHCHFVEILTGLTGLQGSFYNCGLAGTVTLATGSTSLFIDCHSLVPGTSRPTINVNGGVSMVSIRGYKGGLIVGGSTNASNEITVSMSTGRLQLAASNTAGTISCRGVCDFDDQSAGATVETSGLVDEIVFGHIMEAGETFAEQVRLIRADAAGDVDEPVDGTYAIRDAADTKDRIVGTQTANGGRDVSSTDGT